MIFNDDVTYFLTLLISMLKVFADPSNLCMPTLSPPLERLCSDGVHSDHSTDAKKPRTKQTHYSFT